MLKKNVVNFLAAGLLAALSFAPFVAQAAGAGVVIQVSDADPKTWNQALNVVRNIQAERKDLKVELVVFGHGSGMLKLESPMASRIAETLAAGTDVKMCRNTMRGQNITEKDMLPNIGYVKAGVIEMIDRQAQGWHVIRP